MDLEALLNAADEDTGDWEIDTDAGLEEATSPIRTNNNDEETKDGDPLPATAPATAPRGRTGNDYVDGIANESDLHIVHERQCDLPRGAQRLD
ncbi:hypothetical protein PR003_g28941 [Phytophthora rubi]|nr:hypothetical protein PR002_g27431 [Phytophthora rubi]KAE9276882.1 hypothetical protein PR003_g28941 [Phytophthora rubi]